MQKGDLILVTDMQNVYTHGQPWACLDTENVAARIKKICDQADKINAQPGHESDIQIISTAFLSPISPTGTWIEYNKKYDDINASEWLNEIMPSLKETVHSHILYTKSVYSSMKINEIQREALKAKRVILTGVVAECCVLFTAFDAIDLGCKVIYLSDGVSGFTKEKEDASILTLTGLSPLHCQIMTCSEYENE